MPSRGESRGESRRLTEEDEEEEDEEDEKWGQGPPNDEIPPEIARYQ